jgi:hypothetical protein
LQACSAWSSSFLRTDEFGLVPHFRWEYFVHHPLSRLSPETHQRHQGGWPQKGCEGILPATSAIPLPWPGGGRPEILRPPLSGEFALSVARNFDLCIGIP